jgi:hypothetical protein
MAVIRGVDQFLYEPHDEGDANGLVTAGSDDMELMGPRQELRNIERGLTS